MGISMGLFKRKKKEKPANPQANTNESEFDRDVRALLARDDIQCQQDICEAEYKKAQELLKKPTQKTVHRAHDLMGNLASKFDYIPAIMWMGILQKVLCKTWSKRLYGIRKLLTWAMVTERAVMPIC